MNKVYLHGDLAEKYGTEFRMDCRNAIDAVRGLACQLKGFREELRGGQYFLFREVGYHQFALEPDALMMNMGRSNLHIVPYVEGAANGSGGKGAGKLILGIALIALTWWYPAGWALDATIFATGGLTWGAAMMGLGIGMALGGLSLLIAPQPKMMTNTTQDSHDSHLFSGNINPSGQNFAIPVAYGRIRVASYPVASQIETNQVDIASGAVLDNMWNSLVAGIDPNVSYGNPPVIIQNSAPAIPSDTTTLWFQGSSSPAYQPHKIVSSAWSNTGTYAAGIWTIGSMRVYIQGTATLSGMTVGDMLIGPSTSPQVWTGAQWVPA